ncbi:MAG: 16S rRNA (cytosine(1402)-N(4))-methyltransferase RsmH [Pseudoflavonifractor sp.]|nr:16S rRNA (cytosine(1402)-N(4))-methyltransferase RsmH [Alloprevotella sp.]MCM1117420.1 16S rRNA (cytosine(1402)-N(4))-methyltransferase RsmH [Pseudoflavonifractor sp.]
MDQDTIYHIPALLPQSIQALDISPAGTYVDATYGGGGHSRAILSALGPHGRLIAFDQDDEALERAEPDPRLTLVHGNFRFLSNFLRFNGVDPNGGVDGILADLGVSSHHFDTPERGFSFRFEGPLDMRMNRHAHTTAADLLASISPSDLSDHLRLYGELPKARRIADAIIASRATAPVDTIERLVAIIDPLISPKARRKELAQVFQALRIVVNGEMRALEQFLTQALRALKPGGRLAIITYHSLEDRLVKNYFKTGSLDGRVNPDIFGNIHAPLRLIGGSKPIVPTEAEIEANPRSRSAKLRVAEKI